MPVGQLGSLNFANLVTCGHSFFIKPANVCIRHIHVPEDILPAALLHITTPSPALIADAFHKSKKQNMIQKAILLSIQMTPHRHIRQYPYSKHNNANLYPD